MTDDLSEVLDKMKKTYLVNKRLHYRRANGWRNFNLNDGVIYYQKENPRYPAGYRGSIQRFVVMEKVMYSWRDNVPKSGLYRVRVAAEILWIDGSRSIEESCDWAVIPDAKPAIDVIPRMIAEYPDPIYSKGDVVLVDDRYYQVKDMIYRANGKTKKTSVAPKSKQRDSVTVVYSLSPVANLVMGRMVPETEIRQLISRPPLIEKAA